MYLQVKRAAFALFLSLFCFVAKAQKTVTGTVQDASGEPMIGVTVLANGKPVAVTDIDGAFSVPNATPSTVIKLSYVGYLDQQFKVGDKTSFNITLNEDNHNLDEVVVVGYGTMKKSDLAGASTSLDEKTLKSAPLTNIDQSFQGRVAGVNAVQTSGAPGSGISVQVRGQATINAGSDPLYVVDGVIFNAQSNSGASLGLGDALGNGSHSSVSPLSTLAPQDIVSIEVLKDASATAIYGAQGANGVVLITTRKGKSGDAKFTYTGSVTVSRQNKRIDIMNLRQFAEYYNTLVQQGELSQPDKFYSDPSVLGRGTNWQDAIFRTAWQTTHQLSAEGGTEKVHYYISSSYDDQDGTIIGSNFRRFNTRVNLDAQLKKWLKIGFNGTFAQTHESLKLADSDEGLISYSLTTPPDIQIYNIDGSYSSVSKEGFSNPNPIAMAMMDDILLKRQTLNGSIYIDVTPIKNFTWHSQFGYDVNSSRSQTYEPMVHLGTWDRSQNQGRIQKNSGYFWSFNNYVQYNMQFGKHGITAMIGQEAWKSNYDYTGIFNTNLPSDVVHNPALGQGTPKIFEGWGSTSMASFFTRETYNYDDRYLGTYTYRYDGSSNFGPNKRWAGFHSFALAWRFSNEKFIKKFAGKWLSNGKLRLGWGQTGNSNIGGYKWGSTVDPMETGLGMGYKPANLKNPDIKWETQEQWNVGLDLGFFNSRVNLTVDWYKKESKDMLMQLILPSIMGTSGNASSALAAPWGNYGDIENHGFEFALSTHPIITKNFTWDSDVNISINRNKLKSLSGSTAIVGYGQWTDVVSRSVPGQSLYNFYGYKVEGVYTSLEDIMNSPVNTLQQNNPIVTDADGKKHWSTEAAKYSRTNTTFIGDIKYKDINGDGVIDEKDKTNIGSPMPKWTFGWNNTFRWKQWDLNIFINGSVGNKVGNYLKMKLTHMNSAWSNQLTDVNKHAILQPIDPNKQYPFTVQVTDPTKDNPNHMKDVTINNWYDDASNVTVSNVGTVTPRASINDPNDNDAWSDRYIEGASYLRLKSITLGYTFKPELVHKIGLTNLRLTLNATNLFTITGYDGYDPEVGVSTAAANVYGLDNGRYPSPTTVSFGLSASF